MAERWHRVLARQLARSGLTDDRPPADPAAWAAFLTRVDRAYRDADEDRYTLERSQEVSSRELVALHDRARRERDTLDAVLSSLHAAVLELDAAGTVVYANPAAVAAARRDPLGARLAEVVELLDPNGSPVAPDGHLEQPDGAVRVCAPGDPEPTAAAWTVAPLPGGRGGHVVTFTDQSDRVRVQRELTDARVDAEVARRSERTRAAFLANVSHELRTPLNAIIGYTELLREDQSDPERLGQDLDRILASSRHLLRLIDDVLDLSRIDAGRFELHLEEVALGPLLEEVAESTRAAARRNGTAMVVRADGLGTIETDGLRLRQCLLNLAANAAKFTRGGEVVLSGTRTDRAVVLSVADTGIGIGAEYLPQLFRAFAQGEAGTVRRFGGTGLGLAITRSFAEQLGGSVDAESQLGVGSTFRLRLPLRPTLAAQAPGPGERTERGRGGRVVLVVDDDPVVVELVAAGVEGEAVRVVGVPSAETAMHELEREAPAAAVVDVRLPGANGWSLLRAIRGDPRWAGVPVVVVTAGDEVVRATALRLRADAVLQKPLDRERLRDGLRALLRHRP